MHKAITEGFPSARIGIAVVWINMLPDDTEEAARSAARTLVDPRAQHYYDGERRVGRAVAESLGGQGEVAWDMYLFYGPGQEWGEVPPRPVEWAHQLATDAWADPGRYHRSQELIAELGRLMQSLVPPATPAWPGRRQR